MFGPAGQYCDPRVVRRDFIAPRQPSDDISYQHAGRGAALADDRFAIAAGCLLRGERPRKAALNPKPISPHEPTGK